MRDLLFLAHRLPYPPNKGDKVRSFHLLRHLASRYRVHLGTFIDDPADWTHADVVRSMCAGSCILGLDRARARWRSLLALAGRGSLTEAYYRDRRMGAWVDSCLAAGTVSRVVVFSSAMAQYVPLPAAAVRVVVDFVDVDSDKWRQYAARKPWPASWVYRREARTLLELERRVASAADASVFVSAAEAALFRRLAPAAAGKVRHVDNGVDLGYFQPRAGGVDPYPPDADPVVFTGAMDYWANADAVSWFAREVFPSVRARRPSAVFYVVGARPGPDVRRLADLPGVRVTGTVPDVRPYLAHARVAVAPLRVARGVQNKVLEALAMGRPVVATPAALEGIEPSPPAGTLRVDDPVAMAEQVLWCVSDPVAAAALGAAGRASVERHCDWAANLAGFSELVDGPAQPAAGGLRLAAAPGASPAPAPRAEPAARQQPASFPETVSPHGIED
jgi:sugar transferase (PEP-CTERM/EpsH1 system associated)